MGLPKSLTAGPRAAVPLCLTSEADIPEVQPVTLGVPFPVGHLRDSEALCVLGPDTPLVVAGSPDRAHPPRPQVSRLIRRPAVAEVAGSGDPATTGALCVLGPDTPLPVQQEILARWSDGSVKWLLLDLLAPPLRRGRNEWRLTHAEDGQPPIRSGLTLTETPDAIVVETGCATFRLGRNEFRPFDGVSVRGEALLADDPGGVSLTDPKGRVGGASVKKAVVETHGAVRITVRLEGVFTGSVPLRYVARLSFFAGTGLVRLALTVHNPNRARHRGGLWDLGDRGSLFFRDLSLAPRLRGEGDREVSWTAEPGQTPRTARPAALELYQDSSGGENWRGKNHVNRNGEVPCRFPGYRLRVGSEESHGLRANPVVSLRGEAGSVVAAVPDFWQQFPKAVEAEGDALRVRLFPRQWADLHEIQGGEQKTHTVWFEFLPPGEDPARRLSWVHRPARAYLPPEWYSNSGALPKWFVAGEALPNPLDGLLGEALGGPKGLFARRELIDEYGWRNYGDLYADHEGAYYNGPAPVVSHYNNQYDVVYGAILQYLRTGDPRWAELFDPLARHVIDIDIYHTHQDRAAYNGGLFWHTDHYRDAGTCTHRAYSRVNQPAGRPYGGGPCNEHNYTTGLLHYHYLTGDPAAREAVLGLAEWVINMDDGGQTIFGLVDDGPTGHASRTTEANYHGPGRGCGNSVNALLDGWLLSGERRHLGKAEELIRRTIHPHDNIASRDLLNVELRWSYTVFLSVLARYLDLKAEAGEIDYSYAYARASLLHYAEWMLEHEGPYFDHPEKLEFPTETWAAQELRKANVLFLAAVHAAEPLRSRLATRGRELGDRAWVDLPRFESCAATRSIAILLTEGLRDGYWRLEGVADSRADLPAFDFNEPIEFVHQRGRVLGQAKSLGGFARLLARLVNARKGFRWWRSRRKGN